MRQRLIQWTAGLVAMVGAVLPVLAQAPDAAALRADGTRFALALPDGRMLYSSDLVGATLHMGNGMAVRIDAVAMVNDLHGKPLWQHQLSVADSSGSWHNACTPHSDGTSTAMLVPGREQGDGTIDHDATAFAITCTSGAQGKCLRFGYRPWEASEGEGAVDPRARYNACIRMVRADYGGEGRPFTENGKLIDMFDDARIQVADLSAQQDFEAGWGSAGAVCVRHVRVKNNVTLEQLEAHYPALRGRVGVVCTEAFARAQGALVFNRSDPSGAAP